MSNTAHGCDINGGKGPCKNTGTCTSPGNSGGGRSSAYSYDCHCPDGFNSDATCSKPAACPARPPTPGAIACAAGTYGMSGATPAKASTCPATTCRDGYNLNNGPGSAWTCNSKGQWEGGGTTCTGKPCEIRAPQMNAAQCTAAKSDTKTLLYGDGQFGEPAAATCAGNSGDQDCACGYINTGGSTKYTCTPDDAKSTSGAGHWSCF